MRSSKPLVWLFIVTLVALSLTMGMPVHAQEEAVVRFYLFYGETCSHCHEVMEHSLPQIRDKYGDQVEYQTIEVWSEIDNYITLLGLEKKLGVPEERQGAVHAFDLRRASR